MKIFKTFALLAMTAVPSAALAADQPTNPKKQAEAGLYLTAREAAAMKAERGDAVFFIDVRDPHEIMFTGFTDRVSANIPFKTADTSGWNEKKSTFPMRDNPAFLETVSAALEANGLDRDDPILTMCRSGARSAAAANALTKAGFTQVYSVVDGFEAERTLDALFAKGTPTAANVEAATARIGEIDARLRAAHLKAHLRTAPLLTRHQRMIYSKRRGYGAGHGHGQH